MFRPLPQQIAAGDLVWVGNWGDGERTAELQEYLIRPAHALKLQTTIYGVRYPQEARQVLARAGIAYGGWLANFEVPRVFARHKFTVHVPRRPYVEALPGIPTIRPFEAMACGIPLICSPWDDVEGLFSAGRDYLLVRNEAEMSNNMRALMQDSALRSELALNGLRTIRARHTCSHRIDELLAIYSELAGEPGKPLGRRAFSEK
jgi:spore maturation protein CgeB